VTDDDGGGAGGTGETATVTELGLNVGDNGTLGHHIDGEDVADTQGGLGATVEELAGVHAFDSNEILNVLLEFVAISEHDLGKGSTTARIMHDVLHDTLDVSLTLSEIEFSECRGCDSLAGVSLENGAATAPLR